MDFDFIQFFGTSVQGVPLIVFVGLFVEFLKNANLKGQALFYASMAVGTLTGAGFMVSQFGVPQTIPEAFSFIVYGLTLGFVTSKGYDKLIAMSEKSALKVMNGKGDD